MCSTSKVCSSFDFLWCWLWRSRIIQDVFKNKKEVVLNLWGKVRKPKKQRLHVCVFNASVHERWIKSYRKDKELCGDGFVQISCSSMFGLWNHHFYLFSVFYLNKKFFFFSVVVSVSLRNNQLTPQNLLELVCTLYPQLPVIKQMYIYGSAELFQTVSVILSTPVADRRALQASLMSTCCALTFLNTNKLDTSHHLLLCAFDLILKCQDLVFSHSSPMM